MNHDPGSDEIKQFGMQYPGREVRWLVKGYLPTVFVCRTSWICGLNEGCMTWASGSGGDS